MLSSRAPRLLPKARILQPMTGRKRRPAAPERAACAPLTRVWPWKPTTSAGSPAAQPIAAAARKTGRRWVIWTAG